MIQETNNLTEVVMDIKSSELAQAAILYLFSGGIVIEMNRMPF